MHRTTTASAFEGDAHGKVREVVEARVEVPGRQRRAELVARLRTGEAALGVDPSARGDEPGGRAMHLADRASVGRGGDVLQGRTSGQVGEAVVVEVPSGQRTPEPVPDLHGATDLGEGPAAAGGEATAGAVEHADGAGVGGAAHAPPDRSPRPLREAIPVEVPGGQGTPELVARLHG